MPKRTMRCKPQTALRQGGEPPLPSVISSRRRRNPTNGKVRRRVGAPPPILLTLGRQNVVSANRFLVVKIERKIPVAPLTHPAPPQPSPASGGVTGRGLGPSPLPRCRRGALCLHIEQPLARIA